MTLNACIRRLVHDCHLLYPISILVARHNARSFPFLELLRSTRSIIPKENLRGMDRWIVDSPPQLTRHFSWNYFFVLGINANFSLALLFFSLSFFLSFLFLSVFDFNWLTILSCSFFFVVLIHCEGDERASTPCRWRHELSWAKEGLSCETQL